MQDQIAIGMYAGSEPLRQAWKALFDSARTSFPELHFPEDIIFDTDQSTLLNPATRIGHTCGYPLMMQYQNLLTPLCVPCFDVEGSDGANYSSVFLVRQDSDIKQLADSCGKIAAINSQDSNSGMNVFRAAVSDIHEKQSGSAERVPFFESVQLSGSHSSSLSFLISGKADIAAIDAVTYDFLKRDNPALGEQLRSIAYSQKTMGLPLVTAVNNPFSSAAEITHVLNTALDQLDAGSLQNLKIKRFKAVELSDYQSIVDLEQLAVGRGYPVLR